LIRVFWQSSFFLPFARPTLGRNVIRKLIEIARRDDRSVSPASRATCFGFTLLASKSVVY